MRTHESFSSLHVLVSRKKADPVCGVEAKWKSRLWRRSEAASGLTPSWRGKPAARKETPKTGHGILVKKTCTP